MKIFRRIALAVVLLLVVVAIIVYFNLNRIVKRTVESQATSSLNLKTDLGSANLALFGGKLNLNQLQIASPAGFKVQHMFTFDDADIAVSYGQLRSDPVRIKSIMIDKPKLVIENSGDGLNFQKAMQMMPKSPQEQSKTESKPLKLIIDDLTIKDAIVLVHPGFPGLPEEIPISIPTVTVKNIGTGEGAENGAAVKEVVMQLITVMAARASDSDQLPKQFKALLNANLEQVVGQLGKEAQKRIAEAVPGQLGEVLSRAVSDPNALIKNPGKAIEQELGGFMNGKGADTQPATRPSDGDEVKRGLQDLLNQDKKPKRKRG